MIRDLDDTLKQLLKTGAAAGSALASADISFDLPDAAWRGQIGNPTVNLYLYDIRENLALRTHEPLTIDRPALGKKVRVPPPKRIDCAYCITAWSPASGGLVLDEHRLLTQVLRVILQNETIPAAVLQGGLAGQTAPYPTVIAAPDGGVKNFPDFWNALDQKLKPSLNYVVTLVMTLEDPPADIDMPSVVQSYDVRAFIPPDEAG
jgi:Pvc16 N-terminal domain